MIDFSGDSAYSFGGMPIAEARRAVLEAGIVINGLAILCRAEECSGRPVTYDLEAAFANLIIGGPGSFVVTADRDDRFAEAVRRKLVLEIAGTPVRPTDDIHLADRRLCGRVHDGTLAGDRRDGDDEPILRHVR